MDRLYEIFEDLNEEDLYEDKDNGATIDINVLAKDIINKSIGNLDKVMKLIDYESEKNNVDKKELTRVVLRLRNNILRV